MLPSAQAFPTILHKHLEKRGWLLADGALGTNLFKQGLKQGDPPENWNQTYPERVIALHMEFLEAGADIILTNSFGGTRNRLMLHKGLADQCFEINKRAAELARQAIAQSGVDALVAGSMGPTGDLYEPLGPLSIEQGARAYEEQAQGLAAGGADILWCETLSSLEEITAALEGASSTNLPTAITVSFDSNGRSMMGLSPTEFAQAMQRMPVRPVAIGANCGDGTAELTRAVLDMYQSFEKGQAPIIIAKSNAGIPEFKQGKFIYSGTPDHMAQYAILARNAGAAIIGGCCGTEPEHLRQMHHALETTPLATVPTLEQITYALGALSGTGADANSSGRSRRGNRRARNSVN